MIQIWPNLSCTSTSAGSVLAWQYWAILLIVACTCGLVKSKVSELSHGCTLAPSMRTSIPSYLRASAVQPYPKVSAGTTTGGGTVCVPRFSNLVAQSSRCV